METQTLDIPVVWPDYFEDCVQCTERLKEMLESLHGMRSVTVNADRRTLQVSYAKDLLTFEAIREAARQLGVTISEQFRHERIHILGLDCPDCAMKLETAIRRIRGAAWVSVNYATSVVNVEFEPRRTSLASIEKRIGQFGYEIEEEAAKTAPRARKARIKRNARLLLTALSGALLAAGGIASAVNGSLAMADAMFIASAITGGLFAARSGFLSLVGLTLDTNFLMTIASIGAIALGQYSEAAAVMFLFSLGSTLEAYTVDKTRRSIKALVQAFPSHASVRRNGGIERVPLESIEIGEIVLVKPGDNVPVDGTVTDGESSVNEAPITGESAPREKLKGDTVYAGSINGRGSLEVRATSTVEDNTLARIVHMVEEAQSQKAPSQRFSETFGRYYTPAVVVLAVIVAACGPLTFGGSYTNWLTRALTLLVVACPCALVISTPVAIVAAIGNAARSGVLIKGGAHLEALGDVSVVAFDKTGTLTRGELTVCDVVPFNSHSIEEIIAVAAAIESRSEHPLADAVIDRARELGLPERHVSFFEAFPGKGARAVVNGGAFHVGSRRLLDELGIDVPGTTAIAELLTRGCTVVYLADETTLWGAIGATDVVRDGTAEAVLQLKRAGVDRTVMLTGDTAQTGREVAKLLGIDEEHAELLPEDKVVRVREIASGRRRVAMVGDGINDAPALAAADVGIAMGGAGSPAAVEAADIALMADDITMLPYAITLSRKAKAVIRQNVVFALAVVLFLVAGALAKWVNLATGVLGHEGSALLVIANSMRLLKKNSAL